MNNVFLALAIPNTSWRLSFHTTVSSWMCVEVKFVISWHWQGIRSYSRFLGNFAETFAICSCKCWKMPSTEFSIHNHFCSWIVLLAVKLCRCCLTQIFLKIPHFAVCELSNNRNKVGEYNFVCRRKRKANIVIIFDGGRLRGSTASLLQCLANNRATSQQKCFCKTWQLIGVCIFSTAKQIYLAWTLWLLWLAGNFDDVGFW